jgi:hypothetical protein
MGKIREPPAEGQIHLTACRCGWLGVGLPRADRDKPDQQVQQTHQISKPFRNFVMD